MAKVTPNPMLQDAHGKMRTSKPWRAHLRLSLQDGASVARLAVESGKGRCRAYHAVFTLCIAYLIILCVQRCVRPRTQMYHVMLIALVGYASC